MKWLVILVMALAMVSCSSTGVNKVEACKAPKHLFDDDCQFRNSNSKF